MAMFAPGLSITDSASRALTAAFYANDAQVPLWATDQWFPPAMAIAMASALRWTGTVGTHTFVVCWWFYASSGMLLARLLPARWALAGIALLMLYPPIWNHAVAILPDAPTAAAICTILCCAFWARDRAACFARRDESCQQASIPARALAIGGFSIACVVLFSYRANSITLAPLVIALVLWAWRPWKHALAIVMVVLASVGYGTSLDDLLPLRKWDTLAGSLVWEHVGMLRLNRDEKVARAHSIAPLCTQQGLDPLVANAKAILVHDWYTHDSMIWSPSPLNSSIVLETDGKVRAMHQDFVKDQPLLYLRAKFEIWKSLLGLRPRVPLPFINEWVPDEPALYGASLAHTGPLRDAGHAIIHFFFGKSILRWLTIPAIPIALALLLAIGVAIRRRVAAERVILLLMAAGYYAGFFLVTPGFHYRYFFPAHVVLLIAIIAMIHALTQRGEARTRCT